MTNSGTRLGRYSTSSTDTGSDISGEVLFLRGGQIVVIGYAETILVGRASFHTTSTFGTTNYSDKIFEDVISGKIPHGPIKWHVNWDAVLLGYLPIWVVVALVSWFKKGAPKVTRKVP
ncbi:MAG: hypothetical protein NWT08_04665 [Akkermansiaceae bacterium]|nr:hypothetical protein [Akkermansiaceae bacterium]MDP4647506.1 hypothetical protein [Akkermansiaceae bacterium]